jgi:hypothetical protein
MSTHPTVGLASQLKLIGSFPWGAHFMVCKRDYAAIYLVLNVDESHASIGAVNVAILFDDAYCLEHLIDRGYAMFADRLNDAASRSTRHSYPVAAGSP